ncbi:hypothetical protein [Pseudoalteromonas sp. T1lg75]|uniref:hypothetical protein n=1 Tax=Pseudoalteromonas sp. T1lg75 TaxID=2077102 RepID=UPI000CF7388A|nr:hypothetical protein [Pseudoalteromonas sp. T1lg75]
MKLNTLLLAVSIASSAFSAHAAGNASAKFAAAWNDEPIKLESIASTTPPADGEELPPHERHGYLLTTIKVPQDKELLVGVSAEIGLVTDTTVKGKDGAAAKAVAGASVEVELVAVKAGTEITAAPGPVMLSKRVQELSATLGGVLETCTDLPGDDGLPDGTIDVATECTTTDEQIGLMQDTLASHHFNFILPNMDAGIYEIRAKFSTSASAAVEVDGDTASADSAAKALVGKTMVTVQQVRAVKGSLADVDIVENN